MDMAPLDDYRRKLGILAEHCQHAGRDPQTVRKMIHFSGLISEDEADLGRRIEAQARAWNTDVNGLRGRFLFGTPQQAAETLMPYVEAGAEHFVLSLPAPYDMTTLELFIGEVAPLVTKWSNRT